MRTTRCNHTPRAFTIIECLVYVGLVITILGFAMVAFYYCFDNMKGLRRNADDVSAALHTGELWRADVRAASGPIQVAAAGNTLRIPQRGRDVSYKFEQSQVLRKVGDGPWAVALPKVSSSRMQADARSHVTAWRWELELGAMRKPVMVRPLFTFLAVPSAANQP